MAMVRIWDGRVRSLARRKRMNLQGLTLAFELTAALAAVALAWKREDHRPFAAFLIIAVVANDLARLVLQSWTIVPAREAMRAAGIDPAVTPFTGWVRVACDIEGAYPSFRYDGPRKFYLVAELAALSVGIVAFLRWVRTEVARISHVLTSCILDSTGKDGNNGSPPQTSPRFLVVDVGLLYRSGHPGERL